MINFKVCKNTYDDPACHQFGCLNQPAWKFRDDIIFAQQYKENNMTPLMNDFTQWLQQLADNKRDNAGFTGSMNDGGASDIEEQIETYTAGVNGTIPVGWTEHYKQFSNEQDPDYAKYLKLKEKFETRT